jgi:hypothetical protein
VVCELEWLPFEHAAPKLIVSHNGIGLGVVSIGWGGTISRSIRSDPTGKNDRLPNAGSEVPRYPQAPSRF